MVNVVDVVATDDGQPRQREREITDGVGPQAPVSKRLVAAQSLQNVLKLVLRDCAHELDDHPSRQGLVDWEDKFGGALE